MKKKKKKKPQKTTNMLRFKLAYGIDCEYWTHEYLYQHVAAHVSILAVMILHILRAFWFQWRTVKGCSLVKTLEKKSYSFQLRDL